MPKLHEQLDQISAARKRLAAELSEITDRQQKSSKPDPGMAERGANLVTALTRLDAQFEETKQRYGDELMAGAKAGTVGRESGDGARLDTGFKAPATMMGGRGHKAGQWLADGLRRSGVATKGWTTSGATNGGAFSPTEFASFFFDRLAAESVGLASGFNVIPTRAHELKVPHITADTAANWTAEAATITATDATADEITATPRKLAALQVLSNEVIVDSIPAVLDVSAAQMMRSLALKLDLGFFEGTGTAPEIRGLKNVTGIQTISMGTNGLAFADLDKFADAIGDLETENAHPTAIVMHPRSWKALIKLKEQTTGHNKPLLQDSAGAGTAGVARSIYGIPVFLSSQVSITETQGTATNASSAYIYQASEVVAVLRQDTRIDVDSSRLFNSDQSEVRAIMRADLVVPNPKAVVRIQGIIPA